ncbi:MULTISPECIES: protein-L-isoaspartate(D-aspartate) O-methyltransferase [Gammaproteobacteria]|uniref:protein-L-isoaspartate(D-aspartate) O-methyltransferase n=1 Tax=Gammaproteobacteria TaxID=1236 RepID=UPI000DCFB011|nr:MULTISPECIES: protein-L-isoaspartate(D-aspartate) O-methyltransferase [Gammaproteobacteria]RTE87123.1 protein-L-isoaspartate(D-aspartate) O-methyltransferase [Aliidiomarina sp. B3213]TCZ93089.1 protein-L-isoaspartate(D-aspartate) O-methyltransferase [Lysobacter sp. N42]
MLKNFQGQARKLVELLKSLDVKNTQVLQVVERTPRHAFMPESLAHKAYENTALPIGNGQTISQPFIVAKMTALLLDAERPMEKVLEIGTGSGYQTAILAQLVDRVFSVERISPLQYQAKRRLKALDLHNINMKHGDGWLGWNSKGPFDGILVTAAASEVPQALLEQLSEDGGRMVIPVGEDVQELRVIERQGDEYKIQALGEVRFVPLVQGKLT